MKKFLILITLFICGLTFAQQRPRTILSPEETKFLIAYNAIINWYLEETNNPKIVEDAIKAMLRNLDPHSTYSNAEETRRMNEPLEANFDGIGIQFNMYLDTLYVIQVLSGGPSEKAGLLPGDRIVKVDETVIAGVNMSNTDVVKYIKGKKGTTVRIFVKRGSSPNLIEFRIVRDNIPVYSVDAAYMADPKTGYIRLNKFSASTINEFKTALSNLQKKGMQNLILDLQDNGGGYLHVGNTLANLLLDKNKLIVYIQGEKQRRQEIVSTDETLFKDGKLVLMINEGSASASEILAGAIQDWDRGVIVGRRSFGKGLVQRSIDLPDSSMIRLTIARYYTPSGRYIQKPYVKGNIEAYQYDILDRYYNGELLNADSIHFPDSLKYQTLVSQRTVYGGGGIMPDVFIPIDSVRFTEYYSKLVGLNVLQRMVINYLDKNRKELSKNYPNFARFKEKFVVTEAMLKELRAIADEEKIEFNEYQYNKSKDFISLQIKSLIARDLFEYSDFIEIRNQMNDSYQQALRIINNDAQYAQILKGG